MLTLKIKKLNPQATIPTQATNASAGLDLYATEDVCLSSAKTAKVPTGIAVEIPMGFEGQLRGRSGLASKGIWCHLGTIDSDYRGEIAVILANIGKQSYQISRGDRIAQLVISALPKIKVAEVNELTSTTRGKGGFGSSGR